MNQEQKMVLEFHKKFKHVSQSIPTSSLPQSVRNFRKSLIMEEMAETFTGMDTFNLREIADGLADLLYVIYGTAIAYGIDLEPVFAEVHKSNMSKSVEKSPAGKSIKGPEYRPPALSDLLSKQKPLFELPLYES